MSKFGTTPLVTSSDVQILASSANLRTISADFAVDAVNKVLKPGTVVGKITASGKFAIYAPAAGDGTETAVGILKNGVDVELTESIAAVYVQATIDPTKLPIQAGDGSLDAAALVDLGATTNAAGQVTFSV